MEIPATKGCPSQSNRDSDGSIQASHDDDQQPAASDMCSFRTVGGSPLRQMYWGEQMSGVPNSHSCLLSRIGASEEHHSSRREESSWNPGPNSSLDRHESRESLPLSSCWGELKTENPAAKNVGRATQKFNQGTEKLGDLDTESGTPNREETYHDKQSHYDNGNFKSLGSNMVTDGPTEDDDTTLLAMFHAVANSCLAVRSQQKDEPDFTPAQKLAILRDLYRTKPLVFLERFRTALREEHLPCFRHLSGNYEADFYCAEVRRAGLGKTRHTRVRNKRYAALQQLIRGGEYFSDEQMRGRDPLLYEQYIGQYLSDEELQALGNLKLEASCSLSGVLLDSYQEQVIQQRLQVQQEQEEACEEEEEDSDHGSEGKAFDPDADEWVPDDGEKAFLREEFTSRMYQRFLDGKDLDFDYSEVDENPDFDNLDIVSRDEEERYFDGEEPEAADTMEIEEMDLRS
ncbi:coiled-coil domain-containing protein 97 [Candoia aspera]|uniref:coiled-coil domain-containing protein 97 n=1 Tax=Candoia aspera TaxID=51853 RepID=UPI002FD87089